MVNKRLRCLRKVNILNSKILKEKQKLPFTMYAEFESILVPEGNRNQNPNKSYTNKYQKHIACSYGYKLVCVYNDFCKPIFIMCKIMFIVI